MIVLIRDDVSLFHVPCFSDCTMECFIDEVLLRRKAIDLSASAIRIKPLGYGHDAC